MNYRHAFHAGNFGDVLKHVVLARVLVHLAQKAAPYRLIDTHAGIGRYDLLTGEAERTGEWRNGVARVWAADPPMEVASLLSPWWAAVAAENPGGGLAVYPGSPALALTLMRPQDRLTAIELHPEDAVTLKRAVGRDARARVSVQDGWQALTGSVPPPERRGVVLVDPPYEATDEFDRLADGLIAASAKWPTGCFIGWYPIKSFGPVDILHARLSDAGPKRLVTADLLVRTPDKWIPGLPGAGIVAINPPYTLAEELAVLLPWLAATLAQGEGAHHRLAVLADG
jgi:23S rRNA (adenine2030-N6)-methyltransferase